MLISHYIDYWLITPFSLIDTLPLTLFRLAIETLGYIAIMHAAAKYF